MEHSYYTSLVLPTRIPDFKRLSWTSSEAQNIWEPRLKLIEQKVLEKSFLSVKEKVGKISIRTIPSYLLLNIARFKKKYDLEIETLNTNTIRSGTANRIFHKILISKKEDIDEYLYLFQNDEADALKATMNIPECCRESYSVFRNLGISDWLPVLANQDGKQVLEENLLLTKEGINSFQHIPCSDICSASKRIRSIETKLLEQVDQEASHWVDEILSWPTSWSSLHGIIEIKNPILRIIRSGDSLKEKITIEYRGESYPDEGATGVNFPYKKRNSVC